jgi:hypothetical protein
MAWIIQKAPNSRPHPSFPADLFPRPHQAAYLPQPGSPFVPHRACGSPHPALSFAPTGCPARAKCESPACKAGLDPPLHPQALNGRHPTGMAWLIQKAPNSRPHPSFPADLFPRPHQAAYLPQPGYALCPPSGLCLAPTRRCPSPPPGALQGQNVKARPARPGWTPPLHPQALNGRHPTGMAGGGSI